MPAKKVNAKKAVPFLSRYVNVLLGRNVKDAQKNKDKILKQVLNTQKRLQDLEQASRAGAQAALEGPVKVPSASDMKALKSGLVSSLTSPPQNILNTSTGTAPDPMQIILPPSLRQPAAPPSTASSLPGAAMQLDAKLNLPPSVKKKIKPPPDPVKLNKKLKSLQTKDMHAAENIHDEQFRTSKYRALSILASLGLLQGGVLAVPDSEEA